MKPIFLAFVLALLATPVVAQSTVSVCFTPAERCTPGIVAAIDGARREIRVQAYQFTSPLILSALVRAARRGVDVAVILDKVNETERYSGATFARDAGIPVWIDRVEGIAHNKTIVIDRERVIGGSFNFTKSADERNVENVTLIEDRGIAAAFLRNWDARRGMSVLWQGGR